MSKQKLHDKILARIDTDFLQSDENQQQCYNDRRFCFVRGAQWDGAIGEQFANRPKFEFNKIQLSVIRIYNEWAKNRFTVDFRANKSADSETAKTLQELFRADERDSNADEAYSRAFMEGISGGIGAIMLDIQYEDETGEEGEEQRIIIKPIHEADTSVYWDSGAKRYDKSDAHHVTVVFSMSKESYKAEYGREPSSFDNLQGDRYQWWDGENVKVAEHYEVTEKTVECVKLQHEHDDEPVKLYKNDDDFEKEYEKLIAQGYQVIFDKRVKKKTVKGYIIDGNGILEKFDVAGEYLPIIPFYAKQHFISGREVTEGHVRLSKDAQKAYNVQISSLIDLASRPQDELPIFTPEQINGHSQIWAGKEVNKPPYLTINATKDGNGNTINIGATSYTKPPSIPPALSAVAQIADKDINELTGNQANGEELVSNVSTQAVEMVQEKVDAQAYIYLDNFAKTIKQLGKVWLSMAKVVYDEEERSMTGISHDDQEQQITINKPTVKEGQLAYENDIQKGNYQVTVDVGEAFATQRDKTIKRLISLIPMLSDPQQQAVIANTILANLDGEGMEDLSKFARKQLVNMGVAEPNEEEQAELMQTQMQQQNQPPNAQEQYFMAEASKALAEAENKKAQTQKTLADVDKTQADTATTLFGLQQQQAQTNAVMEEMMMILQAMQQGQQQQAEQIKQEVNGASGEGEQIPPELLAQM